MNRQASKRMHMMTASLQAVRWGASVERILQAALQAAEPGRAVRQALQREGERLRVAGQDYDLRRFEHIWVVGAGKAGAPMADAVTHILRDRLQGGTVVVKEGYARLEVESDLPITLLEAGHPLPDERSIQSTQRICQTLASIGPRDLVLVLISGGGSALLVSPAPGLNLADLQNTTGALLASGATINEINTLRKHLDTIKGGGLARLADQAVVITLILSDVVGDPLDVIASGPTVPDPTTFAEAYAVLERYDLLRKVPAAVITRLQSGRRGEIPETPKPGEALFERVQNVIVGSNRQAAEAALRQAREEGLQTLLLTTFLQGEARQAGRVLGSVLHQVAASGEPIPRPACLVAGGETTVTLHGQGLGGRNQELALAAVTELAGLPDLALVSLATDGGDGPTDAAGAVVCGETLQRARQLGLDSGDYLSRNDAYHFFEPLGDLLKPGPTQTNVNDLVFLFAF